MTNEELIQIIINEKKDLLHELAVVNAKHDQLVNDIAHLNHILEKAKEVMKDG